MRIRTIKPEFWAHPVMVRQSDLTNLLALALLNYADDEGFFYADEDMIRGSLFPKKDSTMIRRSIDDLSRIGYITVRNHGTHGPIGRIESFVDHQRIDRPKASIIKELYESTNDRRMIDNESLLEQGTGNREGKGTRKGNDAPLALPFDSQDFASAWSDWNTHRKEIKKKLTPSCAKEQLAKLQSMGEARAIATIRHSIAGGWQGLFEPDGKSTPKPLHKGIQEPELIAKGF